MKTNKPNFCNQLNRREFLKDIGGGFAALGLTGMLAQDGFFASKAMARVPEFVNPLSPKPAPLPAKAKSVIFLFMHQSHQQPDKFHFLGFQYPSPSNEVLSISRSLQVVQLLCLRVYTE